MSEKTEPPSPKKIRDARKKGNYLFSKEVVSGATLFAVLVALFAGHEFITVPLYRLTEYTASASSLPFNVAVGQVLQSSLEVIARAVLLSYGAAILAAIVSNLAQIGFVFSFAKFTKGFKSLDAISNAKQIFAKKNLFSFLMNIIKVCLIGYVVYLMLLRDLPNLLNSPNCGLYCTMQVGVKSIFMMAFIVWASYIPMAALDYLVQRYFYLKELRMSIEEVKQEFKESEGSPEIKSHRRQQHQEILNSSMMDGVRKSSAVIVNPTRVAVAIYYDEEETPLPRIMGKGEGALAQAIRRVAEEEGIPIYESVDLARSLHDSLEIGEFISTEFIDPVAEVLHYIRSLEGGG